MAQRGHQPRIWRAIYRRLVALYPRSLRRELGEEIEGLFVDLYSEARQRGRGPAAWFALRACAELLPRAFAAHGDPESPTGVWLVRNVFSDLRFAWQVVTRQRRHTLVALATIAIGIGATTAVFSVADAALLRPLPFPEGHRLVDVGIAHPAGWTFFGHAGASFRALRDQEMFDWVGGYDANSKTGRLGEHPEEIYTATVSHDLPTRLGARPLEGRLLVPEDAAEGAPPTALVSESVWRRAYGVSEQLDARPIRLDGVDYRVVGVIPDSFAFPYARTGAWIAADPASSESRFRVIGRLAPGIDVEAGRARTDAIAQAMIELGTLPADYGVALTPLESQRTSARSRTGLLVALGAAGLLLAVAVVNVAQVSLARALRREGELAVRAALGAGRTRIVRQVLFESLLLSLAGGLAGIALAVGLVSAIGALAPGDLIRYDAIRLGVEWRAFMVGMALAALVGVAAGLLPAWSAARPAVSRGLHSDSRSGTGSGSRRRLQSSLIVAETALCLVLLAGAGLLFNSFQRLANVDPGFDADPLVSMVLLLDQERYPTPEARMMMLERLADRFELLPGVVSATPAGGEAPHPGGTGLVGRLEGVGGNTIDEETVLPQGRVTARYFTTTGVEVVEGRPLDTSDHDTDHMMVSEPLARRLFGNQSAVGRTVRIDEEEFTVVGVAAETAVFGLDMPEDNPFAYFPLRSGPNPRAYSGVIVRAAEDPAALAPVLEQTLWEIDPDQPVHRMDLGSETIAGWVLEPRFNLLLSGTFAGVALLLVLVGVGGVVGQAVASRTREIGIRVALGANRRSILSLATLAGLRPVLIGLVIGAGGVWQSTHLLSSLLFGVEPTDPPTLLAVGAIFVLAAAAASYIPARRALRVDPVRALRTE